MENNVTFSKIDIMCDRMERRLTDWSKYSIVIPGVLKQGMGVIQTIVALLSIVGIGIFAAPCSPHARKLCCYAFEHLQHGLGNIVAGTFEAIPIAATVAYIIRKCFPKDQKWMPYNRAATPKNKISNKIDQDDCDSRLPSDGLANTSDEGIVVTPPSASVLIHPSFEVGPEEYPQDKPLTSCASQLEIAPVATTPIYQDEQMKANPKRNLELSLQLVRNYEAWMRRIALEDFEVTLPDKYVKYKLNDFLEVYYKDLKTHSRKMPTHEFIDHVLNPIYNVLHSEENRRQLVLEIYKIKQDLAIKKSPKSFLSACIMNEFGERNILDRLEEIYHTIMSENDFNKKSLSILKSDIKSLLNLKALETLRHRLIEEFGIQKPELIDAIMNDWSYIGIDIKHDRAYLSDERIQMILQKARSAFDNIDRFEEILADLKHEMNQGLPADETLISQRYTDLKIIQKAIPEEKRNQMRAQIVHALASQQKNKMHAFNDAIEGKILVALGFNVRKYNKRSDLRKEMLAFLSTFCTNKGAWYKSIPHLKIEILEHAFHTRMDLAGVPPRQRDYIKKIKRTYTIFYKRFTTHVDTIGKSTLIEEIERIDIQRERYYFYSAIRSKMRGVIHDHIFKFISTNRPAIRSYMGYSERFNEDLENLIKTSFSEKRLWKKLRPEGYIDTKMKKEIAWYVDYGHTFVQLFRQGADEPLGDGCCNAHAHRLAKTVLLEPHCSLEMLDACRITPEDRVSQAAYSLVHFLHKHQEIKDWEDCVNITGIPSSRTPMKNIVSHFLFEFQRIENPTDEQLQENARTLASFLKDFLINLSASNGAFILNLRGHAIFIRMDRDRHIFQISDSNNGVQDFNQQKNTLSEKELDDMVATMSLCIERLTDASYGDTSRYIVKQLAQKSVDAIHPQG